MTFINLVNLSHVFRHRQCIWAFVEVWENSMMPEDFSPRFGRPLKNGIMSNISPVSSVHFHFSMSFRMEGFQNYKFVFQVHPWFFSAYKGVIMGFSELDVRAVTVNSEFEVKGQKWAAWVLCCHCCLDFCSKNWIRWHKKGDEILEHMEGRCVIMCRCFKWHVFSFTLNKSDGSFFQSTSNGKLRFNYVFLEHLFPGARGTCWRDVRWIFSRG